MDATAEHADLRREVQRLQAENARLSRLLELRGQDTAPSPEQLSAPVAAPGTVTMASPVADKLALFADRFRARTDVYAVRWETLVRVHPGGRQPSPAALTGSIAERVLSEAEHHYIFHRKSNVEVPAYRT